MTKSAETDNVLICYKECPGCTVMTDKTHGCNKINCTNCKVRWCFHCGLRYANSRVKRGKETYEACPDPGGHKQLDDRLELNYL